MLCDKANGINCEENEAHEDCGQLENAKFQNYGCKSVYSSKFDYFDCTNRMDKKELMFEKPPIPQKGTKAEKREAYNFNTLLSFDKTHIYCGKYNFSFTDFYQVEKEHGMEQCDLANGDKITLQTLWIELMTDFSFEMTHKMNEL